MHLHRFILNLDLISDQLTVTDRETTNQIRNVFRMDVGDRFILCDGKGREGTVQITALDGTKVPRNAKFTGNAKFTVNAKFTGNAKFTRNAKFTGTLVPSRSGVVVDVLDRREVLTESSVRAVLYCAMLKRENFELVVQKATECGVAEIVPIVTARTVKLGLKIDRLQKIAREAAEQSGRGIVPEIFDPMSLKESIVHAKQNNANILFEPSGSHFLGTLVPFRLDATKVAMNRGLFIGPEGGWTDDEVDQMRGAGYHVVSLGPRVLRAETAAIVAVFYLSLFNVHS